MDGYFILFLVVGVVVHELGHAAVARALGGEVVAITIGTGPRVIDVQAGSVRLGVRLIPLSGLTVWRGAPAQRRWPRLAVSLAGCAVNLLIALGVIVTGVHGVVRGQLLITSLALGLYNLVPVRTLGGAALDGLTALTLLRGSAASLTPEQLAAARAQPLAASSVTLRQRLRRQVDRGRDAAAAALLAQLPAGEAGRPARPAGEDLERLRQLVSDETLPAGRRAGLAYQAAATGLPGLDPAATALPGEELDWCSSMLAMAAELAPRAWPVLQVWALTLTLQGPATAARGLTLARRALDWATPSSPPRTTMALLEATAAFAAARSGAAAEAVERRDRARALDPECPALRLVDAELPGTSGIASGEPSR